MKWKIIHIDETDSTNRVSMPNGVLFEGDKEVQLWMEDGGSRRILAIMAPLRVGSMWGWLAPEA